MVAATDVQIIAGDQIDVAAHAALQQRVFGHVLEENGIPMSRLGADVFAWKLMPPAGPARVAVALHEGQFASSCTAYPVMLGTGEGVVAGWHLCDAATAPEARGRGLYGLVMTALLESLSPDDWLFAFPNHLSRGAFDRQGFTAVQQVPLWFRPTIGRPAMPPDVVSVSQFDEAYDAFAARLAARSGLMAMRSRAYLTWRYLQHPFFDYDCFVLRRGERVDGVAIVNRMAARGRVSMWVMELLALERDDLKTLAKALRAWAKDTGCDVILSMSNARLPGAIRMPSWLLPKKHVLVVRSGEPHAPKSPGQWDVYTGDWDTF